MAIQTVKTGAAVNDGTGDDARTAFTKINQNFTDSANAASRLVGEAAGNVMKVGAFGIGGMERYRGDGLPTQSASVATLQKTQMYNFSEDTKVNYGEGIGWATTNADAHFIIGGKFLPNIHHVYIKDIRATPGAREVKYARFLTTGNTTVDSNGLIKAASPIVRLFVDKIELNDEAKEQDITFEKLSVGDYLIKGSTGFAQEGWYIEMPKDANGNVLVAVVYEQLANNDISVKTYDYMLNKKGRIVPDLETPLDIPETRWVDLRLQALPQDDTQPLDTDETVATNAE